MTSSHNTREHVFFFCFLDSEKTTRSMQKVDAPPPEYFPHLSLLGILHLAPVFQQRKYLTALTLTTLFYLPYLPSFVSTDRGEEWTCSDLGSKLGEVLATHWCLTPLDFVYLKHLSFDFDTNCSYEKPCSKLSAALRPRLARPCNCLLQLAWPWCGR